MYRLLLTGMVALTVLVPAATTSAQSSNAMEQLYGRGVHAYHSGQMQNARDALSQAVDLGSRDPRVYYFRGLAHGFLDNKEAAMKDFKSGAQLEATTTGRHFDVNRALERVQGEMRLEIENARRTARLAKSSTAQGSGTREMADKNLPVVPDPMTSGQAAGQSTNFPDVTGVQNPGTPFSESAGSTNEQSGEEQPMIEEDPFGDTGGNDSTQAAIEEDPFGDQKSDDPPMEEEDPFGDPTPAAEEAAGETTPPDEEDPFGDQKTDDKKVDDDPPAEEENDPFGGSGDEDPSDVDGEKGEEKGEGEKESPPDDPFGGDGSS